MGSKNNLFRKFCFSFLLLSCFLFFSCGLILDQLNPFGSSSSAQSNQSSSASTAFSKPVLNPGFGLDNSGSKASRYFVRPGSGGEISLNIDFDSDIWYLFTNTSGKKIPKPYYVIPSLDVLPVEDNLITKASHDVISTSSPVLPKHPELPEVVVDGVDETVVDVSNERETKSYYDTIVPKKNGLGDYVGKRTTFYEVNSGYITATCKFYRSVKTANGERTLVIYQQDDLSEDPNIPTSDDYKLIADSFLKDGLDNDIYDKLTALFGSEWGYLNATFLSENSNKLFYKRNIANYLIPEDDTITILYCDIGEQGAPSGPYVAGYFFSGNTFSSQYYSKSNERAMVSLHAYTSGGKYIGSGLTTLSHEFQHLIHDQYFNQNLSTFGYERPLEKTAALTECFSSIAENYTAQFIAQSTDKEVPGPFYVGYAKNDSGFLTRASNGNALINGRAPYYLYALDKYNVEAWEAESLGDDQLSDYGLVASLGHYILVNYGAPTLQAYVYGTGANLDGLVDAINSTYSDAGMTKAKLIADWGTAVMLSSVSHLASPYAYNKMGWYNINGMKVPSVNIWNYTPYPNAVNNYYDNIFGIQSQSLGVSEFANNTNNPIIVKRAVPKGTTYNAIAPILPEGLALTVVAVPR